MPVPENVRWRERVGKPASSGSETEFGWWDFRGGPFPVAFVWNGPEFRMESDITVTCE